mmetsp:Transcript_37358/g.107664  ORF Transcript_37358/g.107664 Transcript_37358/m.107664 type:complete len:243 (-) Transcript_37358:264-992(-)
MAAACRAAATIAKQFACPVRPRRIEALLFSNFEMLDVFGPLQLFKSSNTVAAKLSMQPPGSELLYQIRTVGFEQWAASSGGPAVKTDVQAAAEPGKDGERDALTTLLIPGGLGTRTLVDDPTLIGWIASRSSHVGRVATVCTGAVLAGRAGVLDGAEATTNKMAFDWVVEASRSSRITWQRRARWVQPRESDTPWTAAGVSAGMDMAYAIIAADYGQYVAQEAARHAEYTPQLDAGGDEFAS